MRSVVALAVTLVVAICFFGRSSGAVPGNPNEMRLSGSLYKTTNGRADAVAVVGSAVYARALAASDSDAWLGPVLTDEYGRFAFVGIPAGNYLLRMYSGDRTTLLWQQTVQVPEALAPIVIRDVRIVYYPKTVDGTTVDNALLGVGLPYDHSNRTDFYNPHATNTVWFGDNVDLENVKTVADALLRAGVHLRAVRRFTDGSGWKAKVIEVGSSPQHLTGPDLKMSTVDSARDFPRANP
jgi:hypothetical protein